LPLRYCLPRVSRQGYGLDGLVPWARAFLAAQVLDATLLAPAFDLNRCGYWREPHTPPYRWFYRRAIEHVLPKVEFTQADYLAHGGGDVVPTLRSFARARRLPRRAMFMFVTEGAWGGFHHVRDARDFMRSTLYRSRYSAQNLLRLRARIDVNKMLVGMHVWLGESKSPAALGDNHCAVNAAMPLDWFVSVARSLQQALGDQLQFLLVSNGTHEQLQPLLETFPCISTAELPCSDCSDVLALADADLLVCSPSVSSQLAAVLSDSPYLWFVPAASSSRSGRGIAVAPDGAVPRTLIHTLRQRHAYRGWQCDLVRSGVIRAAGVEAVRSPVQGSDVSRELDP
jgi:hypothetical protein